MAAVVEFAVTITDVLGGAVGPLAFARDSLERAVSAALPGGARMLRGLHVRGGGVEAVYFTLKGPEPSRYWRRLERDAGAGNGGVVYRVRIEDRGTEVSYTVCAWSNGGV